MNINDLSHVDVSLASVLAVMATLGYVFGTLAERRKAAGTNQVVQRLQRDLSRANLAARELGKVVLAINSSTATHCARLKKFQNRIARLGTQKGDAIWHELCREVEGLLEPTLQLVNEITVAQERIRYQSNYLMTFSEAQTDPLTGLGNRRALDHVLGTHCTLQKRYGAPFSLAVVDIDHFKDLNDQHGHQHGDQMLRDLTDLLKGALRAADILARYGGDEFVVVMPQTDLTGAATLGERLRLEVERGAPFTVSVGVTSANATDTPESIFKRADTALYDAKSGGRNRMCCRSGELTTPIKAPSQSPSVEEGLLDTPASEASNDPTSMLAEANAIRGAIYEAHAEADGLGNGTPITT
jgi:diguanylate cyclase